MRELLNLLIQHPYLGVLVVMWVFSSLASAAGKAGKRAQQQRSSGDVDEYLRRRRQQVNQPTAPPVAHSQHPTADDIARQMREMLGLEPSRPRVEARPEAVEGDRRRPAARDSGDEVVRRGAPHVGELHEEVERRRQERKEAIKPVPTVAVTAPPATPRTKRPEHTVAPQGRPLVQFDAKSAVAAMVAMEVLGPPRALRPHDM
jgi:hypothetical protein